MLVAGSNAGTLWQSITAEANSLVEVPRYATTGGKAPTGIVLDPRSQHRYFVADNTNLFGTRDQGAQLYESHAQSAAGRHHPAHGARVHLQKWC